MLTENDYAQWLFNTPGLGSKGVYTLLDKGYSCEDIFKCPDKELRTLLTAKKADALIRHRQNWNFELERIKLEEKKVRFVSALDTDFPKKLKNIPDPPFGLYVRGKLPDENRPSVAIIGARMCSDYGRYMAREFGRNLSLAGVQIISGMARGIDSIAQTAVIDSGGYSLALLGGGVDVIYPKESSGLYYKLLKNGGVMSEHAPGTEARPHFFALRNRLISGLSDVVCVVEAKAQSGTLITVDTALEQGREVYAVPGRISDTTSFGTNELIRQGAGIISDLDGFVADFLNSYSQVIPAKEERTKKSAPSTDFLSANEKLTLKSAEEDSVTADILSGKTGLPAYELIGVCVSLCQKGMFKSIGAGRFVVSDRGSIIKETL